jgi:hypothetical protein
LVTYRVSFLPATARVVWVRVSHGFMDSRHGPFEHEEFAVVRLTRGSDQRWEPNSLEKARASSAFVACF